MTQFKACEKCDNGYRYEVTGGYKVAVKCQCRLQWELKAYSQIRGKKAHLRPSVYNPVDGKMYNPRTDYRGNKSRDSMQKMVNYVEGFVDKFIGQSIYLYGPHSTQKTTIAQWAALDLMNRYDIKAQYILMKDLVDLLTKEGWEDKEKTKTPEYNLDALKRSDLLIIDESFDKNKITIYKSSYQIPFLDQFLRHRLDVIEKPIIFISNVAPEFMIRDFPSLVDLSHLIDRRITKVGASLKFEDNFVDESNEFELKDIFA